MPTITLNRTEHKAFIERLAQGSAALLFTNMPAIDPYVRGWLYEVDIDTVDNYTIRPRVGYRNKIEAIVVTYTIR